MDFTATARLANGLTVQGGTSTGRAVRDNCDVTRALPELLLVANINQRVDSCNVTEKWATSFRGLASYTFPKIDVLVSASLRSLETTPAAASPPTGSSLAANYVVPNAIIVHLSGAFPPPPSRPERRSVNLLNPWELYTLQRFNLVDIVAKIIRFADRRWRLASIC